MPGFCVFGQMLQGNPSSGEEGFDILTSRPIAKCGTVGAIFAEVHSHVYVKLPNLVL